jgi:glutamine---fructose-6-phosphate transaminase (isomerizing)
MPPAGFHTYQEIITQPDAWAEALQASQTAAADLRALWAQTGGSLLFTGCGSTYYLSLAAAALAREAGLPASGVPASELWMRTKTVALDPARTLLVAVSRSGETSETLRAVDAFRAAGGGAVAAITCYPGSGVTARAAVTVTIPAGREESVAQTRSFAAMLVASQVLIAALGTADGGATLGQRLQQLPELGRELIERAGPLAAQLGGDMSLRRFFFLGNGALYGLAEEAMLKMKEMSLSYSEGYHVLEFRHGPKSMVDDSTLVVGLLGDEGRAQEAAVLAEMHDLGGYTLALGGETPNAAGNNGRSQAAWGSADHRVILDSSLSATERLVLYLPALQLLAYHTAVAKGLDPDRPRNLTAAVLL